MKIAHLLPTTTRYPLPHHHGRHDWALRLATMQAKAGHEVTMFAGAGSQGDGTITFRSTDNPFPDATTNNLALLHFAFRQHEIDIYHSHFDYLHYFAANITDRPVVFTQHWSPTAIVARAAQYAGHPSNIVAVPVTKYMAAEDKRLHIPAVAPIYHGVDLQLFDYAGKHGDRFLFVGRITPTKGVREAIQLVQQANAKLDIIGKIIPRDVPYWETIRHSINGTTIRYLGEMPQTTVAQHMQRARALLFPNQAPEAFGQTIIEAQACGTPVITSDLGAAAELVQHNISGFICKTDGEFIQAIQLVGALDPSACRTQAEKFDISQMVVAYTGLYEKLTR